jgi:chromosome segregation ATPase
MKRGQFRGRVVGPVGAYVKRKSEYERYGAALELALGRTLTSFIVTCSQDSAVLRSILLANQCDYTHNVIVQTDGDSEPRYGVQLVEGVPTALDAIVVEDNLVFNCLVDQCRIESVLLVERQEEVERYVRKGSDGRDGFQVPQISRAILNSGVTISFKQGARGTEVGLFVFTRFLVSFAM